MACELADGLPLAAAWTLMLCARMRTRRYDKAAARERVTISDASAVVVQWSICLLTLLELAMLSAAERQQSASLHNAEQQQRLSAHSMLHAMRRDSVHVAV
jgi:hypothetical protein